MTNPTIGIMFEMLNNEPRSVIGSDMSVIGLVGTGVGADATAFPYNVPVAMFSDDTVMAGKLGTGTLLDAVLGINDQLGELQSAARLVVVRIDPGANTDATITNLVGSSVNKTGIWALPEAGPNLGIIPRLIGVPGFTSQVKLGLKNPVISSPGSGGANGTFAMAFTGGTGSGAAGNFTVAGGIVTAAVITNGGVYTVAPTISLAASSGLTGASVTATFGTLANPVAAALPAVLNKILAMAVLDGPATTLQGFTDWRETLNSDRLIPLETAVKVGVNAVVKPGSPYVLGIMARRDHENGGLPGKSAANQPVYGIVGPNRPINFSLTDGATEGQAILALNGSVILRGEAGVETAISSGGFIFLGTDTSTDEDPWQFYSVVRMRDYIHLAFLKTLRVYLGRYNMSGQTIQAIYNTMVRFLRDLKSGQHIIGYKVTLPLEGNPVENLRQGRVQLLFQAEEPAPIRLINIQSARYLPALDELLANLQSQLEQTI